MICTQLRPGHLSVRVGDSLRRSEEIVKISNCAFQCDSSSSSSFSSSSSSYYYYYYYYYYHYIIIIIIINIIIIISLSLLLHQNGQFSGLQYHATFERNRSVNVKAIFFKRNHKSRVLSLKY